MFLYGASGHAKVIIELLESQHTTLHGLIDDNPAISTLSGYPVVHDLTAVQPPIIISIGNNNVRKVLAERLCAYQFATAIHATAIVSPRAHVGEGTVVMQGAIIQSDTQIGKHCIINTGVSVDHECHIGDYVHLSPHTTLCGNVSVGEGSWLGAGTIVIPGVKIGKWCVIGAGSVVSKDIPDGVLAVGNRCKVIKQIK